MIVADVNLIAYLLIEGQFSHAARGVLEKDDLWIAPHIWRDEFINVLATHVRAEKFSLVDAMEKLVAADALVNLSNVKIDERDVIQMSVVSRLATFDCTYIWLARNMSVKVVTHDQKMLDRFTDVAVDLEHFAGNP